MKRVFFFAKFVGAKFMFLCFSFRLDTVKDVVILSKKFFVVINKRGILINKNIYPCFRRNSVKICHYLYSIFKNQDSPH